MNVAWTPSVLDFVRLNADKMKDKDLAIRLSELCGRDIKIQSIRKVRQKLGIKKIQGRGKCGIREEIK